MAGGIDWLRWHHGTVADGKFRLVAKRAGGKVSEVIAVWAFLMEAASQSANRGDHGDLDFEAIDCALELSDGLSERIHAALTDRRMIAAGRLTAWEKRQPKREREDNSAAERKRKQRAKSSTVTPSHAESHQKTPRGEESREEENLSPPESNGHPGLPAAPADASGAFEGHDDVPRDTPNPVAAFAVALTRAGFQVTAMNPDLCAYVEAGGTVEHLLAIAADPDCAGKKAGYPIRFARRELAAVAAPVATGPPRAGASGKTAQGIHALQRIKDGLADKGNIDGLPEASMPRLGPPAGG